MQEIFKDIKGYEGYYQVSNLGRIKSRARVIHRNNPNQYICRIRLLKQQKAKDGYMRVSLWKEKNSKAYLVHRIVAKHYVENNYNMPFVNHKNGIRDDNNSNNLEWVSRLENNRYLRKTLKTTSSKYKGVSFFKRDKVWHASIMNNYKNIHLGYHKTQEEAAKAYNKKAIELFGRFAILNVI